MLAFFILISVILNRALIIDESIKVYEELMTIETYELKVTYAAYVGCEIFSILEIKVNQEKPTEIYQKSTMSY